jgi:hypothetical protein
MVLMLSQKGKMHPNREWQDTYEVVLPWRACEWKRGKGKGEKERKGRS